MDFTILSDFKKSFEKLETEIFREIDEVEKLNRKIKSLESKSFQRDFFSFQKKVLYYISKGIKEDCAVNLAREDYGLPAYLAEIFWRSARQSKPGLRLYARAYCVQKMRAADFTTAQIAQVLGISKSSVERIIKEGCVLE